MLHFLTQNFSLLLDQALRVLGNRPDFMPENARVSFKRWKVLQKLGRVEEAERCAQEALTSHRSIHPDDDRRVEEMVDGDFDKDIMFWSR